MKKIKVELNPETGVSSASIQKGNETFSAEVKIQEEDMDIISSYAGCSFAELKASIKVYKSDYKKAKAELKTLETLYDSITKLRSFEQEQHTQTCQHIRKQIRIQKAKVEHIKNLYEYMQETYPKLIERRLTGARNLQKKIEKNND